MMNQNKEIYECVIVGGGSAGLSAALILGRSRRRVLVCDKGNPRNAPAHESHSFFTRDGISPHKFLSIGRDQIRPVVDSVLPWSDIVQAHQRLEKGGMRGKIVLQLTE